MLKITASPEYLIRHHGPVVVMGAGPDAEHELARVRARFPEVPIIAVNFMATVCKGGRPFAVVTADMLRDDWKLPGQIAHYYPANQQAPDPCAWADHVWRGPMLATGTGSLPATVIALAIGFAPVILCGVPLQATGHAVGYPAALHDEFERPDRMANTLRTRREAWMAYKEAGHLEDVRSMSGFTRDLLGGF